MVNQTEVEKMMDVQVRAYAADDEADTWTVECTDCGPLGISSDATVDTFAVNHMTANHGAEMVTS